MKTNPSNYYRSQTIYFHHQKQLNKFNLFITKSNYHFRISKTIVFCEFKLMMEELNYDGWTFYVYREV